MVVPPFSHHGLLAEEHVSHGPQLLKLLKRRLYSSNEPRSFGAPNAEKNALDVEVKVIVKHTFVEVVDPRIKLMARSKSDSELIADFGVHQIQYYESPYQKDMQDLSDASTEDLDACSRRPSSRDELVVSDDDAVVDELSPSYQSRWNVDSWLTCTEKDSGAKGQPPVSILDASAKEFVPSWIEPTYEVNCALGNNWLDRSVKPLAEIPLQLSSAAPSIESRTTVMVRNVPNQFNRSMLLELLGIAGFSGHYDFVYMPIDFKSQANLGYAFINFISGRAAVRFFNIFDGFSQWKVASDKVCSVTWSSPHQGLDSHIERYQNSPVMHSSVVDEWKPALFRHGVRIPFPPPTKPLKPPKLFRQQFGTSSTIS